MKIITKTGIMLMSMLIFIALAFPVEALIFNADVAANAGIVYSKLKLSKKITSKDIKNGTIKGDDMDDEAIDTDQLADGAVTADKIAAGTLTVTTLADGSVTSAKILDGTILTGDISADTILAVDIATDAVGALELANDSVASANIINETIVSADIFNGTIDTADIALLAITNNLIDFDTIEADSIATGAVATAEILNGTILGEDLASGIAISTTGNIVVDNANWNADAITTTGASSGFAINTTNAGLADGNIAINAGTGSITFTAGSFVGLPVGGFSVALTPTADADSTINPGANNAVGLTVQASTNAGNPSILALKDEGGVNQIVVSNTGVATFTQAITATGGVSGALTGNVTGDVSGNAGTVTNGVYTTGIGTVTSTMILDATILAEDIAANAVTASKILDGEVGAAEIATDAVGALELADNSVASANIIIDTIAAVDIAEGGVASSEILNESILSEDILNGTIATADIANLAITNALIGLNVILADSIATGAVTTDEIFDGTIADADTNGALTGAALAANTLTAGDIATDGVGADEITANAVTSSEIATSAVETTEILNGTILAEDLAANAVTSAKILNGEIVAVDLAADTIDGASLADTITLDANLALNGANVTGNGTLGEVGTRWSSIFAGTLNYATALTDGGGVGVTTISLGTTTADLITIAGAVQGATPLVFDGATAGTNMTTLTVTDPTGANSIVLPNASGTIVLTGSTSTVDSTMITNATIAAADLAADIAITTSGAISFTNASIALGNGEADAVGLTGDITIGTGASNDVIVNSNTWDINAAGAATGFTGLVSSGTITFTDDISIGDGAGDDVAVNSGTWDVTAAGAASGLTGVVSTGTVDFSGATKTLVMVKGTTGDPATCTVGEIYVNDTDNTVKACVTANTWAVLSNL